jgi:GT2 family glycosyltransferase
MNVSLVLCSKNGGERLKRCLAAIDQIITQHALDVVLVDNGSNDGSFGVMQDFVGAAPTSRCAVQVLTPGNSAGRNRGILETKGEIITFVDDDCYVDSRFIDDWVAVFGADEKLGYATGKVLAFNAEMNSLGCRDTPEIELIPAHGAVPRGLVQGSNMAFRRTCLEDAGPFDPRFGAGTRFAGEEWDVAIRASAAGWSGGYFPGPTVFHDHGRDNTEAGRREAFYDFGGGAVYMKSLLHPASRNILRLLAKEIRDGRWSRRLNFLKGAAAYLFSRRLSAA